GTHSSPTRYGHRPGGGAARPGLPRAALLDSHRCRPAVGPRHFSYLSPPASLVEALKLNPLRQPLSASPHLHPPALVPEVGQDAGADAKEDPRQPPSQRGGTTAPA